MGLVRVLLLWSLGCAIAFTLDKQSNKLWHKRHGIIDESTLEIDRTDLDTTKKHFKVTASINIGALLIAAFVPVSAIRWLVTIGCGMVLAPVFYNVFYNCLKKSLQSKIRLFLTITCSVNLLLIIYTLNYLYWGYLHKVFV
ncbi:MAG: hypothetical protein PHY44_04585 [Lachnospiraceae bacterium]|nr:hypothetical protein [Lachnospiraceae bacterium]